MYITDTIAARKGVPRKCRLSITSRPMKIKRTSSLLLQAIPSYVCHYIIATFTSKLLFLRLQNPSRSIHTFFFSLSLQTTGLQNTEEANTSNEAKGLRVWVVWFACFQNCWLPYVQRLRVRVRSLPRKDTLPEPALRCVIPLGRCCRPRGYGISLHSNKLKGVQT